MDKSRGSPALTTVGRMGEKRRACAWMSSRGQKI
jgi:hypothetical protein